MAGTSGPHLEIMLFIKILERGAHRVLDLIELLVSRDSNAPA